MTTDLRLQAARAGLALAVAMSLTLAVPGPALAGGLEAPSPDESAEPSAPADAAAEVTPSAAAVEGALADGDLTTARELAVALREADPSVANHRLEAEVWAALGDHEQAVAALDRAEAGLAEDAPAAEREAIASARAELEQAARGSVVDEPESTHRERLDRERSDRLAALAPKVEAPPPVVDAPAPRKPIIEKWYFWVTLGAIVATAGAIVGVAATANSRGREDDDAAARLGGAGPSPASGLVFRF
ncbi:hypothetical protein G6O69_25975 [Pseudenhygromyxa sp. WMMC2535]|uniref:hypothetical protein n=1 Tax=Pseudenhygromyxa sp. WMMC2535 TaxID=2712867 RepID=UPI0015577806|nr:hypothetical protein [Pseudenhygromyxa sp. WMMC2535]NVB41313.1 hypothetical protein [Pseudenhygromyxa sp. WMMC2535]